MASTISAGTTAGTALNMTGDTTGNLAFQTTAGAYTQTMPNATGTVMVSGNMPAFSAYLSANQSITTNTFTKLAANTKEFDTASCYDNVTNYRFTPTVAGYYQVTGNIYFNSSSGNSLNRIAIYKNGSVFKYGTLNYPSSAPADSVASMTALIYMNGTTDYVELYGLQVSSSLPIFSSGITNSYFQAALVRGA
jgi:hypothetical protein